MDILKKTKKFSLFFLLSSATMVIIAVSVFGYYYDALNNKDQSENKVLGVKTQNSSELNLFRGGIRLVKTVNNPTVYAVVGNQKHLLRNEEAFYSYDYNFRDVEIVSQSELDKYKLVRLVKEKDTGRVYYLNYSQNLKKYHLSPQAFAAYASNRWEDVVTISSKDLSFWQEATLLKTADTPNVYFIANNKKAWVPTESEFINAGFQWDKILTVAKTDLDAYTAIDYSIDLVRGQIPSGPGQLIVTLDKSSPKASVLPFATAGNIVSNFKFQAVRNSVKINSITLTKGGIISENRIESIYLEDENGTRFGDIVPVNNWQPTIRFAPTALTIPKNSQRILRVKVNFASGSEVNYTVNFGIQQESDIEADADVSGIFPLVGETHKLVAIQGLAGQVSAASIKVNDIVRQVNIGTKKETVAKFQISETSGNEKVAITKIIFTNEGSARSDDIDNIALYEDKKLAAKERDIINGQVVFDLTKKNIVIDKNDSVDLAVKVDILQGENSTLKFIIADSSDIQVQGLTQEFNLVVSSPESFPVGRGSSDSYNKISFKREGIGFFAYKLKEKDREIYRDQSDVTLAKFELRNINSDIYLQRMKLQVEKFNNAPDLDSELILKDATGKETITNVDKIKVDGGVVADFSLKNYKVSGGKTIKLEIISDVPEHTQSNNAYRIFIKEISYKIGTGNKEYVEAVDAYGQLMLVYVPEITLSQGVLGNDGTAEAGDEKVELARFTAQASADEKIKITEITLSLTQDDVSYVGGFSDLVLYVGSSRKSSKIAQPSSRTYTFSDLSIKVSPNKSISLIMKADTEIIAAGKTIQFKLDVVEAQGYSSKAPAVINGEGVVSDTVNIIAGE